MFCRNCGSEIADGEVFCSECGARMGGDAPGAGAGQTGQAFGGAGKKRRGHKGLLITLGIVAATLIIGGTAFVAMGGTDKVRAYQQLSLGNRYLDELEYDQAIAAFEEAIEIDPSLPQPYLALADIYVDMGDYDSAIRVLKEGLDETGSPLIEERLSEILDEIRGFYGYVYAVDTDLDDSNNKPLKNVRVEVNGKDREKAVTDRNGRFELTGLDKGEYELTFSMEGYLSYTTSVKLKDERVSLDVVLESAVYADMYGSVVVADSDMNYGNNDPLSYAEVTLHKLTGSRPYDATTRTDGNGQYMFEDVVMGVYDLTIKENGYQETTQRVVVYEGQTACYNALIEVIRSEWSGEGTASGTIYDALTGYGVGGLTLNIREGINNTTGNILMTATSNQYGSYITPSLESGNYTIEIVDERSGVEDHYLGSTINVKVLGGANIPNQDGTVSTTILSGQIRIVMSWGSTPADLDSHLFCDLDSGDSYHIYYEMRSFWLNGELVADLDLDDTDYYGPETTTIYSPLEGIYTFGVHDFSYWSDTDLIESGAMVQVYMENSAVPSYVFYVPQERGYYWEVFTYNSKTRQLIPVNSMMY